MKALLYTKINNMYWFQMFDHWPQCPSCNNAISIIKSQSLKTVNDVDWLFFVMCFETLSSYPGLVCPFVFMNHGTAQHAENNVLAVGHRRKNWHFDILNFLGDSNLDVKKTCYLNIIKRRIRTQILFRISSFEILAPGGRTISQQKNDYYGDRRCFLV